MRRPREARVARSNGAGAARSALLALVVLSATLPVALVPVASASSDPRDLFAGVAWSAFPSARAAITDTEAAYSVSDPTHGPAHGVNPAAVDLASGATSALNPGLDPTTLWALDDPDHLLLRMRLGGSPLQPGSSGALYHSYHWNFLLDADADGMSDFVVDVFGGDRAATASTPRYRDGSVALFNNHACEDTPTGDVLVDNRIQKDQIVWAAPASKKSNAHTRAEAADGAQSWLSVAIPWSEIVYATGECAGVQAIEPGTRFGLFASTSASNTDPLQKDWMADAVLTPALTLTKSADVSAVRAGDAVTYTIVVLNAGTGTATSPVLVDAVPPGTSFVSADEGGVYDDATGEVRWTLPSLAPGEETTRHLTVRVDDPLASFITSIDNVAFSDDSSSNAVSLSILRAASPTLSLSASPAATGPGGAFDLLAVAGNAGDAAAKDVTVTLTLSGPATLAENGCTLVGPTTAECALGELAPGEERTLTFPALADRVLTAGEHRVQADATLTHMGGAVDADPAVVNVIAGARIVLTDTGPGTLEPGERGRFDIAYENVGNGTALDVVISWTPPTGVTIVGVSAGGVVGGDGIVRWDAGDVVAGGSGAVWVDVQVADDAPTGETIVSDGARADSPNASPAQTSTEVVLVVEPRVALRVVATPSAVGPGDAIEYNLSYENDGNADANAVVLVLTLVGPATFTSASDDGSAVGSTSTWSLGKLAKGGSGFVLASASAHEGLVDGQHVVTATPSATSINAPDSTGAAATVTVVAGASLALSAQAPAAAAPGEVVTWRLTWTNLGNGTTSDAVLTDAIPTHASFVSATDGGTLADQGAVRWTLGPLPPGASATVSWTGRVAAIMPAGTTALTDDARLEAAPAAPARASATTLVTAAPALSLTLVADRAATGPGGVVTYTLLSENVGNAHASSATLALALAGPATPTLTTWDLGELRVGEPVETVQAAHVDDLLAHGDHFVLATGTLSAIGAVSDAVAENEILVVARARLTLASSVEPARARPNDDTTWTLTYGNDGNASIADVLLTDVPPDALVNVTPDPTLWQLGALAAGATGTATFTGRVRFPMPSGETYHPDDALLEAPGIASARAKATLTVVASPELALTKAVDRARASARDLVTYTIGVENVGDANATGVRISDEVPALVSFVSASEGGGYDASTGAVQWVVGDLPVGTSATVSFVVRVARVLPDVDTPIVNEAKASSAEGASGVSNAVTTLVRGIAHVSLTKTADVGRATEDETIVYTITATSDGSADARGVLITDALPPAHVFVSAQPAEATWNGSAVSLLVPLLPGDGGVQTLVIVARVGPVGVRALPTCNLAVVSGTNVQTSYAEACVELNCALPQAVASRAVAISKPIPMMPALNAFSEQAGDGSTGALTPGTEIQLADARVQVTRAQTSADVDAERAVSQSSLVLGRVELLGGRIQADGVLAEASAHATDERGTWSVEGSRFLNLTIDGVRYDDVSPNTIVPLGPTSYVALKHIETGAKAPTHGRDGVPTRTVSLTLTMIRVVVAPVQLLGELPPVEPVDIRLGVATATATKGVAPDCGPSSPHARVMAEALGVGTILRAEVDGARVTGASGGSVEHGLGLYADALGTQVEALVTNATADVTRSGALAEASILTGRVVLLGGLVTADALYARISTASGSPAVVEEVRWVNLRIAGQAYSQEVAPNTRIPTPMGVIVLNEQVAEDRSTFRLTLIRVQGFGAEPLASVGQLRVGA